MTEDARFEDARDRPLNIGAMDPDDLAILSALAQDAVFPATEMTWQPRARRFAILLNRLRREEAGSQRPPERVQSVLVVEHAQRLASQGIDRSDKDTILSLLSITFEPGEDAAGHVILTLAGDGAIRAEVEALELTLKDVTRPYLAPSGKTPTHPD
ncbi:DUF2948 family protein [Thalassococcus sp. BH17M4-6]|uniref:DUF2948 family protein n=1 Tax=Thalassococcus sp. BH17M4-6 TaxID=3413148 RepID=UPI003BDC44DF